MVRDKPVTRRQVASILVTGSVGVIAGCIGSDGDDEDEDAAETTDDSDGSDDTDVEMEEDPDLTVSLEDEDGESVSSEDVTVEILDHETDIQYTIEQEIEDGIAEPDFTEATTYTVTVVSEEYEAAEQEVSLESGDDEEISFELASAS